MPKVAVVIHQTVLPIVRHFDAFDDLHQVRGKDSLACSRYSMDPKTTMFRVNEAVPFRRAKNPIACPGFVMGASTIMDR